MGHHRLLRAEAGRTPNLDRLAQEGTLFLNAYTCQPVCGPARACLQTGRYATEVGCFRNNIHLPHDVKTLADYLNENDYETAYVGKWHLASSTKQGIDHQRTAIPEEYRGGYRSQIEPHHQNDHNRFEGPDGSKERFREYEVPGDLAGTEGDWRENYPDYLGQCHSLDENVGRLIDTLKAAGEWENTIFIYTSDHGSHFRTRNREYKRSCHDGCTHIPLIVPFPVSWTVKMKKKQKETQDILSYHSQAAGCSDKTRAKASGGRQPIEECGRTGL